MHPLILRFAEELAIKLGRTVEEITRDGLNATDFPADYALHIALADGSFVQFRRAFYVLRERHKTVAVFTEHSGYHQFSTYGATICHIHTERKFDDKG